MKILTFLILALFSTLSMNAQLIADVWNTGEDNTKVELTENDGIVTGIILSSDNSEAKIGNQILKDFKMSNGEWKGKIYAAKRGEWYDATIKENGDQLDITIKVGWASKTVTWKKD